MDGVPGNLPSLLYAFKVQSKAASVGFDWKNAAGAWPKIREELDELEAALAAGRGLGSAVNEELGDVLFSVVNVARHLGLDPEAALRDAAAKFRHRFAAMEALAAEPRRAPIDDDLWDEVKAAQPLGLTRGRSASGATACPLTRIDYRFNTSHRSTHAAHMSEIEQLIGREILDSRGNPTVEVEVLLDSGATGRAAVPSGASTGAYEAVELRDGGDRYGGKGVLPRRRPRQRRDRRRRRRARSARPARPRRRSRSTWTGRPTSPGSAPTPSSGSRWPWPRPRPTRSGLPLYRYVGGAGAHVLPVPDDERAQRRRPRRQQRRPPGVHDRARRGGVLRRGAAVGRRDLPRARRPCCTSRGLSTAVGDEGGFAPNLPSNEEAVKVLVEAIEAAGPDAGRGHRHRPRRGRHASSTATAPTSSAGEGRTLTAAEFVGLPGRLVDRYPDRLDRGRHGRGGLGRLGGR